MLDSLEDHRLEPRWSTQEILPSGRSRYRQEQNKWFEGKVFAAFVGAALFVLFVMCVYLLSANHEHQVVIRKITSELQEQKKATDGGSSSSKVEKTLGTLNTDVKYLQALSAHIRPRSCEELLGLGVKDSGQYVIDPDGNGVGEPAVTVQCNMFPDRGVTVMSPNLDMVQTLDPTCKDPSCLGPTYKSLVHQIQALMFISSNCFQSFSKAGDGQLMTNQVFRSLDYKEIPLESLEKDLMWITKNRSSILCFGKQKLQRQDSCKHLQLSGHKETGLYILDDPSQPVFSVVMCNMHLPNNDTNLQGEPLIKWPRKPVAFDLSTETSKELSNQVMPFTNINLDTSNATSLPGMFTAPIDGIYQISVFFDEHNGTGGLSSDTKVSIRVNEKPRATMFKPKSEYEDSTNGDLVIVRLKKGDRVDVFAQSGGIGSAADTHFSGHLIAPL